MYKCGWNGCEKAYGTLNHLNAHVTMQSHGAKRTPEGTQIILHAMYSRSRRVVWRFPLSILLAACRILALTPVRWIPRTSQRELRRSQPSMLKF